MGQMEVPPQESTGAITLIALLHSMRLRTLLLQTLVTLFDTLGGLTMPPLLILLRYPLF